MRRAIALGKQNMGKIYDKIDDSMLEWISEQKMFFVSTAPLSQDGLINCSPKGMDTFRVLGDRKVGYLDMTGSGVETIAHLKENGRIVIMFCSFEGAPKIIRFHGKGAVFEKGSSEYGERIDAFEEYPGTRSIIEIEIDRISDSCGFTVPLYEFKEDRGALLKWAEQKGPEGVLEYQQDKNLKSLDGLPGLKSKV